MCIPCALWQQGVNRLAQVVVGFTSVNSRTPSSRTSRSGRSSHSRSRDTLSREERKEATRRAIVAAALKLLEDRSFAALSLREVTREAGIVPAAFYRHFESMEALGLVLIDESFRALRDMLRGARAGKLDPEPRHRVLRRHRHRQRQRAARTLALHRPRALQRRHGAALRDPHRDSIDHFGIGDRPGALSRPAHLEQRGPQHPGQPVRQFDDPDRRGDRGRRTTPRRSTRSSGPPSNN